MMILNIQGMSVDATSETRWKIEYLRNVLKSYDGFIPIISISETWLKSKVTRAQIDIPSYTPYRSDRQLHRRG